MCRIDAAEEERDRTAKDETPVRERSGNRSGNDDSHGREEQPRATTTTTKLNDFPHGPVERLLRQSDPCSAPSDNRNGSRSLAIVDTVPDTCGLLRNLRLHGTFPTARWITDPTMPADVRELFGGTPFFTLGQYHLVTADLRDGAQRTHRLLFLVNCGVPGLSTGYWGAVYCGPHCWARFRTTGRHQTTVTQQTHAVRAYTEHNNIDFFEQRFAGDALPGICRTQLERILGLAAEFVLLRFDHNPRRNTDPAQYRHHNDPKQRRLERRKLALSSKKYSKFVS